MGDPIDDYLNQITGEGGGTGQPGDVVAVAPVADTGSATTLQQVLAANGQVTGITPLPQAEADSLAAIMGGTTKEPILRYFFGNGKYVDVGSQTSNVYRGTAVTALGAKAPSAPTIKERGQWNPATREWEPANPLTQPVPKPTPAELYYNVPHSTADPMSGLTQEWASQEPYADTKMVGDTLYGLRKGGTQWEPVQTFPRATTASDSSAWARLAWEQQWEPQKFALEQQAKREAAAAAYKQFVEEQARTDARNRLTNTTQFTNNLLDTWVKAAPQAMLPGQTQFLGGEPGGLASRIAQMGGFNYDPNLYRPQPIQLDPADAWRQAQELMGQHRG